MVCLRNISVDTLHKDDIEDDDDDDDDNNNNNNNNNNNSVQLIGTDRHDESNSRFSQFCEHTKKRKCCDQVLQEFPAKMYRVIGVARRFSRFADLDTHFACLSVRRSDNRDVTFTPDCWRTVSERLRNSHVFSHCPVTSQSPTLHVLTPPACRAMVAT